MHVCVDVWMLVCSRAIFAAGTGNPSVRNLLVLLLLLCVCVCVCVCTCAAGDPIVVVGDELGRATGVRMHAEEAGGWRVLSQKPPSPITVVKSILLHDDLGLFCVVLQVQ